MSESITPETSAETVTATAETPVEKKKSPLELVKERRAAMNQNRGIKASKSGGGEKAGASEAPSSKPMRSSASKQGG